MDTHLDPTSIALLNLLTEKQKDYALTLYANREKKASTAYILWVVFGVYYFYLGHPVKNILLWILCGCFIGIIWWIIDPFPHLRHGEAEESGDPEDLYRGSPAALPEPRAARVF